MVSQPFQGSLLGGSVANVPACRKLSQLERRGDHTCRFSGFHTDGGGGLNPPLPEILKLSMVIIVLSQVLNNNLVPDFVRSNLNSKFSWGGGGGGSMPPDPPSRHTRYYHPATILFPLPTQNPV